jgi:aspartyl-tRNA(Asn)/glutamyl-tRNA(Gln) amidotransferase subunit A
MDTLRDLTIKSFHDGLLDKKFSALEIAQASFDHIKKHNPEINAFLSLAEETAAREAEAVDLAVAKDEDLAPLAGVPLAIKDNILIIGLPATAASKILENYIAAYDAGVIKKLKSEQAVFLGKANLDEFAMGASTENSAFGVTKNPHDTARVAGGSSGGSAAAVAAHFSIAALGSDTGGSIRLPANFCGVVGMSPTYGAVSRSGVIAMASSLDQVGPITKTVEDAAILFKAIAGHDPLDATSQAAVYENVTEPKLEEIKKLTIGLPEEYFAEGTDPMVTREIETVIEKLKSLGIRFKKVSLPHTKYGIAAYYILVPAEVSSNLARFDGVRYARNTKIAKSDRLADLYLEQKGAGFGPESKRRIILGTYVLSSGYYDAYYDKAQRVRTLVKQDFDKAFESVDVLLTPVAPTPAFEIGKLTNDPLAMYLMDVFTIPLKLGGFPGISIPTRSYFSKRAGLARGNSASAAGLPVGFQLIGKKWHEADILGIGQFYEKI